MKRRAVLMAAWLLAAGFVFSRGAAAQGTIKVGVLHSLSGTMAISETTLKDTILMMIDAQNKKGGLLGKKLEAVVVDPASNWPLFAEKAQQLLEKDKVAVVFGCWKPFRSKPGIRKVPLEPLTPPPIAFKAPPEVENPEVSVPVVPIE